MKKKNGEVENSFLSFLLNSIALGWRWVASPVALKGSLHLLEIMDGE